MNTYTRRLAQQEVDTHHNNKYNHDHQNKHHHNHKSNSDKLLHATAKAQQHPSAAIERQDFVANDQPDVTTSEYAVVSARHPTSQGKTATRLPRGEQPTRFDRRSSAKPRNESTSRRRVESPSRKSSGAHCSQAPANRQRHEHRRAPWLASSHNSIKTSEPVGKMHSQTEWSSSSPPSGSSGGKFVSQLYLLVHMSLVVSLLMHHKMMLSNETQREAEPSSSAPSTFHYHVRRHQQMATAGHGGAPSADPQAPNNFDDKPGEFVVAAGRRHGGDLLVFFVGPWHAKRMLHYSLCYMLASSVLILVCLRLFRLCKTPSPLVSATSAHDDSISGSFKERTRLDYTPVLVGSIGLGFVQLMSLGLDIANNIDILTSQQRWPIFLATVQFAFVSLLMQFTLCQVTTRKNVAEKPQQVAYNYSQGSRNIDAFGHSKLRHHRGCPQHRQATSILSPSIMATTATTKAHQRRGGHNNGQRALDFVALSPNLNSNARNNALACHHNHQHGKTAAMGHSSNHGSSFGANLHNIALAHLLVTQILLWLLELNSISLFHVPSSAGNRSHHAPPSTFVPSVNPSGDDYHARAANNSASLLELGLLGRHNQTLTHTRPPELPPQLSSNPMRPSQSPEPIVVNQTNSSQATTASAAIPSTTSTPLLSPSTPSLSNHTLLATPQQQPHANETLEIKSQLVRRKSPHENVHNLTSEFNQQPVRFTIPSQVFRAPPPPSPASRPSPSDKASPTRHQQLNLADLSNRPLRPAVAMVSGLLPEVTPPTRPPLLYKQSSLRPRATTSIPKRSTVFKSATTGTTRAPVNLTGALTAYKHNTTESRVPPTKRKPFPSVEGDSSGHPWKGNNKTTLKYPLAATRPPYASGDPKSERRKPAKPIEAPENEQSGLTKSRAKSTTTEKPVLLETSTMAPTDEQGGADEGDQQASQPKPTDDEEPDSLEGQALPPLPPDMEPDNDEPETEQPAEASKSARSNRATRANATSGIEHVIPVGQTSSSSGRKSPGFSEDEAYAFNEAAASDLSLAKAEMLGVNVQPDDQFGAPFWRLLLPIVRQYHILVVAILLQFWLDSLTRSQPSLSGAASRQGGAQTRPGLFSSGTGYSLTASSIGSRASTSPSESACSSLSIQNSMDLSESPAYGKGAVSSNRRSCKHTTDVKHPARARSGRSAKLEATRHRRAGHKLDAPSSGGSSPSLGLSPTSQASSEGPLWSPKLTGTRNLHLYSTSWPNAGDMGLFGSQTLAAGMARPSQRSGHASACSLFFGLLVSSGSMIAILLAIDIVSLAAQSLLELLTIITCLIGLCIVWRTRRQHRRLERLELLLKDSRALAGGATRLIMPLGGRMGGILLASDHNKRLWQSKPNYELLAGHPSASTTTTSHHQARRQHNSQAFHCLFLVAAYVSGASIALNLDRRHSMEQIFSQQVVYFIETRLRHSSPSSPPSSTWDGEPSSLHGSLAPSPIEHYQFMFHLALAIKALLLVAQVTIQTILVRCSCELSSRHLRHIYTFLMFANMSLWAMEVCSDPGRPDAHAAGAHAKLAPLGQPESSLEGLEAVTRLAGSLVTLSHLYHGLVFI